MSGSSNIKEVTCPYKSIGCDYDKETKYKVSTHLNKEQLAHASLLVNHMVNASEATNERLAGYHLEMMRIQSEWRRREVERTEEFEKVKEEIRGKDVIIAKLAEEIENVKNNERNQREALYSAINELRSNINLTEDETKDVKNKTTVLENEVKDMKNETIELRKEIEELKNENSDLKNKGKALEDKVKEFKKTTNVLMNKTNKLMNEVKELKDDNIIMKNETNKVKKDLNELSLHNSAKEIKESVQDEIMTRWKWIEDIKEELKKKKDEMNTLRMETLKYEEEDRKIKRKIENERMFIESMEEECKKTRSHLWSEINSMKIDINKFIVEQQGVLNDIKNIKMTKFEMEQTMKETQEKIYGTKNNFEVWTLKEDIVGEAYFCLDRFSIRKNYNEGILSHYFYSHNYGHKLRLEVYPGGVGRGKGSNLSVKFVICKGKYDDKLSWPCIYSFKLAVVKQSTGDDYKSELFSHSSVKDEEKYNFNKPLVENNSGLEFASFISHKALQTIEGLIVNDVIVIKCSATAL